MPILKKIIKISNQKTVFKQVFNMQNMAKSPQVKAFVKYTKMTFCKKFAF